MNEINLESLYDKSFTMYRCSPLHNFPRNVKTFEDLEEQIAALLCENLGLYVVGQEVPSSVTPKGKITKLRFQPLELEEFEYDGNNRKLEPLKFELEIERSQLKTIQKQSLIMIPATDIRTSHEDSVFKFYPLVLSKATLPVFHIIEHLFEKRFDARMELLKIPHSLFESLVTRTAEVGLQMQLRSYEHIAEFKDMQKLSSLKLEYLTNQVNLKTFRVEITTDQLLKLTKLIGDSKKVYAGIWKHIFNGTKLKITALHLNSVSCHIASLSASSKIKIHHSATTRDLYGVLYELIDLASEKKHDEILWV
ncbi:hypothetical protein BD770DRAFT_385531 [Pilaira anomala]|nr:hypothetical protein BD770DRAFT_385531 [Pilaira anomala]